MNFIIPLIIGMVIGGCLMLAVMGFCIASKDSEYRERIMMLEHQLRKAKE